MGEAAEATAEDTIAEGALGWTSEAPIGLPAPLDAFVGREDEIAELKALLASARLVTLVGPGGAGKTRLALELAARVGAGYPDGISLVELAGLTDERLFARRVAASLGVAERQGERLPQALVDRLRGGRTLLILDNCEHLIDASARLVVTMLRGCPGLTVLTTSRQPLEAPGEHLYPVHGLSLPPAGSPRTRGELLRSDAVRLFVERTGAVVPTFELTRENGDEIAEMCARLDGNPLAIELAARLARLRPIDDILDRLDDRLRLLSHGTRTAEHRHRDLRAVIEWSYELLPPEEQCVFRRLSVLAGWFTVDSVLKVCAEPGLTADDALHLLGRLETSSLIVTEHGRPGGRFRLMESIRLYGHERLAAAGEDDDAYERLVTWMLDAASPVVGAERLPRSSRDLAPLDGHLDTLRYAMEWAGRRRDDRRVLLAAALAHRLLERGRLAEGRRLLEEALNRTDPAFPGRSAALACAGVLAALDDDGDEALTLVEEGLALEESAGRPVPLARVLLSLQAVRRYRGELRAADDAARRCLSVIRPAGAPMDIAMCLHERARLAIVAGDLDDAGVLLEECLAIHGALIGETPAQIPGEWSHTAATLALARGDADGADRRWREALDAYRRADPPPPFALEMVAGLAVVAAGRGDTLRALRLAAATGVLDGQPRPRSWAHPPDLIGEAVASARSTLPAAAVDSAVREGEGLGATRLIAYALDGTWSEPPGQAAGEPVLTDRERQVARLVAEGLTNRQIARRLHVSERTVHTHLERIRVKLGLPSRTHIVRWVVEEGG